MKGRQTALYPGNEDMSALPDAVRPIRRHIAYRFIRQYHYLGYPPRCDKFCLGVLSENRIVGVLVFGLPVARLEDQKDTLELTRMVLLPETPKNSGSRTLSLAEKWIRKHRQERRLIAYADTSRHRGTIYLAAGWKKIGQQTRSQTWDRPNRKRKRQNGGPKAKFEVILS